MAGFTLYAESLWISPYVFSSFVMLREKGLAFNVVEVALVDGEHLKPGYTAPSVTGRVPSLDHDGFRLAESSAIAEYLEEIAPSPQHPALFPDGIAPRARARQLMAWLRSDLAALRDERSTVTMFYTYDLAPLGAGARKDAERLLRVAEQVIPEGEGPLFGGFALVDAELAFMLHRLLLNGEAVPERVATYARRVWGRSSVHEFVAHPRPAKVPDSYWTFSGTPPLRPARA
jgi:glutathione S-transferase